MTIAEQLSAAGVDLDAEAAVRLTWGVRCGSDQSCRFGRTLLPSREDAEAAAQRHEAQWPGHRTTLVATVTIPLAGRGTRPAPAARSEREIRFLSAEVGCRVPPAARRRELAQSDAVLTRAKVAT